VRCVISDKHLTSTNPELKELVRSTPRGMAHWPPRRQHAGTSKECGKRREGRNLRSRHRRCRSVPLRVSPHKGAPALGEIKAPNLQMRVVQDAAREADGHRTRAHEGMAEILWMDDRAACFSRRRRHQTRKRSSWTEPKNSRPDRRG